MSPRRIAKLLAGFGAVALAAILTVTVVVVRHRAAGQKLGQAAIGLLPGTLLHAHNFHWTQMKGNQSQWVLTARDANYSDDKTSLTLTNPEISMTSSDGKHVDLSANSALLNIEAGHIKRANMMGGLVVHYGDLVLTTDSATFTPDNDELEAPGPVTIQNPGLLITGIGLSGHPKAQTFQLQRQVSTRITPRQTSAQAKTS
jgi:LPS export ABC transporter protein LptC